MKKLLLIALYFSIAALLFACSKEDRKENIKTEDIEEQLTPITFIGYTEDDSELSKTVVAGQNYKRIDWCAKEKINIFYKGSSYKFASNNTEQSRDIEFTGTIPGVNDVSSLTETVYALYPYNDRATIEGNLIKTTLPNIQTAKENSFDNRLFISIGKTTNANNISFKNVCSGLYFTVTNSGVSSVIIRSNDGTPLAGDITIDVTTLPKPTCTVVKGYSEVAVNAPAGKHFTPGVRYYVVTLPGTHTQGITMEAWTSDKYGKRGTSNKIVFERSIMNKALSFENGISFINTPGEGKDLSTEDVQGFVIPRTTANCYIVKKAGDYKFPVVYGNALNGVTKFSAFTSDAEPNSNILSNFTDHLGGEIKQPWVSMAHKISRAELVWQDVSGLISNIQLTGTPNTKEEKYVTFKINTFAIGNALIAVYDDQDNIAWSWHIWCYNGDLTPINVKNHTNYGGRTYSFMPVNLGWDNTSSTFYQWGRKDPFVPGNGIDSENKTWYNATGTSSNKVQGIVSSTKGVQHIAQTISNPNVYYTTEPQATTEYEYNNGPFTNLWSANETTITVNGNKVVKTIYDPSPVGYCLPPSDAYTGFTKTGGYGKPDLWNYDDSSSDKKKITFYAGGWKTSPTISFFALGWRSPSKNTNITVSSASHTPNPYGRYWQAVASNHIEGRYLYFCNGPGNDQGVTPNNPTQVSNNRNRLYGFTVRSVKEDSPAWIED